MIINCKDLAISIKNDVKNIIKSKNLKLTLALISVNQGEASKIYLKNKIIACNYCGIETVTINANENATEEEIINTINRLNNDKKITAIIVQLPLPKNLNEERIINTINPKKDVDCLTNYNLGKFFYQKKENNNILLPCTANGCIKIIKSIYKDISGKKAVIIGRSNISGKPIAQLLLQENCSITILHSKSKDISEETLRADIIVIAIGKAKFLKKEMINKNSLIIDVGINRINNKIYGDVDFDNVSEHCKYITPVPNGVGKLTVACLLENILKCFFIQESGNE